MDREVWSLEKIRDLFDLTGKVAIVTGGSGAFGQAAAKGLAAFGADVVITGRHADTLEAAAADIAKAGTRIIPIPCDATDPDKVEAMVARTVDELGHVDVLVTASGVANRFAAEEFPIDEWQKVMDSLVKGTYVCCQAAGKRMISQGNGKIITVGSIRGELGHPGGYSAYGTAKGAVHLLTKQLATEWAKYHINVNSHRPLHLLDAAHAAGARRPQALPDLHAAHPLGSRGRSAGLHRRGRLPRLHGLGLRDRRHPHGRRRQQGGLMAIAALRAATHTVTSVSAHGTYERAKDRR